GSVCSGSVKKFVVRMKAVDKQHPIQAVCCNPPFSCDKTTQITARHRHRAAAPEHRSQTIEVGPRKSTTYAYVTPLTNYQTTRNICCDFRPVLLHVHPSKNPREGENRWLGNGYPRSRSAMLYRTVNKVSDCKGE